MTNKAQQSLLTASRWQQGLIIFTPLLAALLAYVLLQTGYSQPIAVTIAVCLVCVVWWVFEPIPIPVTSLVPLSVFQISGVLDKNQVAESYGNPVILLLLGGFILSRAMERSGAHRRLALYMIKLFGGISSRQLVFGFMVTSAVLSMWISNTATTLMLLPVALAVISNAKDKALSAPLMLGIAWAASIGGMGTPIGTPPNLIFMQVYEQQFGMTISFLDWMKMALPVVIILIPVAALWVTRKLDYRGGYTLEEAGSWRTEEKRVLMVFAFTALAWITRQEPFGGWSALLGMTSANDASVALIAVIMMFLIPNGKGEKLLDWETASSIPWGVLLLFGGGICLARAFVESGLSTLVGDNLTALAALPLLLMMLLLCLGVTFLTETTSNTASSVLLMPILAATAISTAVDPRLLMFPAVLSASCAFMLPVATAPNSIIYGSNVLTTRYMAREGFVMNIIGALIISMMSWWMLT